MFGRKNQIIEGLQADKAALLTKMARRVGEIRQLEDSIGDKNKKIRDLVEERDLAYKKYDTEVDLTRRLNQQINELTAALTGARKDVTRAERAANAAIEAGGVLGDQVHAAEVALAQKDATIGQLMAEAEEHKTTRVSVGEQMEQLKRRNHELEQQLVRKEAIIQNLVGSALARGVVETADVIDTMPTPAEGASAPELRGKGAILRDGFLWPDAAEIIQAVTAPDRTAEDNTTPAGL